MPFLTMLNNILFTLEVKLLVLFFALFFSSCQSVGMRQHQRELTRERLFPEKLLVIHTSVDSKANSETLDCVKDVISKSLQRVPQDRLLSLSNEDLKACVDTCPIVSGRNLDANWTLISQVKQTQNLYTVSLDLYDNFDGSLHTREVVQSDHIGHLKKLLNEASLKVFKSLHILNKGEPVKHIRYIRPYDHQFLRDIEENIEIESSAGLSRGEKNKLWVTFIKKYKFFKDVIETRLIIYKKRINQKSKLKLLENERSLYQEMLKNIESIDSRQSILTTASWKNLNLSLASKSLNSVKKKNLVRKFIELNGTLKEMNPYLDRADLKVWYVDDDNTWFTDLRRLHSDLLLTKKLGVKTIKKKIISLDKKTYKFKPYSLLGKWRWKTPNRSISRYRSIKQTITVKRKIWFTEACVESRCVDKTSYYKMKVVDYKKHEVYVNDDKLTISFVNQDEILVNNDGNKAYYARVSN